MTWAVERRGFEVMAASPPGGSMTVALVGIGSLVATGLLLHKASRSRAESEDLRTFEDSYNKAIPFDPEDSTENRRDMIAALYSWGLTSEDIEDFRRRGFFTDRRITRFFTDMESEGVETAPLLYWVLKTRKFGLAADLSMSFISQLPHPSEEDAARRVNALEKIGRRILGKGIRDALLVIDADGNVAPMVVQGRSGQTWDYSTPMRISIEDLERIAELPADLFKMQPLYANNEGTGIDWREVEHGLEALRDLPADSMAKLKILPGFWMNWKGLPEDIKQDVRNLSSLHDMVGSPQMKKQIEDVGASLLQGSRSAEKRLHPFVGNVMKLAGDGRLKTLDELVAKSEEAPARLEDVIAELAKLDISAKKLKTFKSYSKLYEMLDEMGAFVDEARAADRLAQKFPEWAISSSPEEYERGKRIAPVMGSVVQYIANLTREGKPVVIHGRDGELLYEMLKRRPDVDMSKVTYAITSRTLTTENPEISDEYEAYLHRVIPPNAVHIDTGFAGSIPKWIHENVTPVADIKMISANDPEEEIPISVRHVPQYPDVEESDVRKRRRQMVITDLEDSAQRLQKPRGWEPGKRTYSPEAPGFWARLYGAMTSKAQAERARRFWALRPSW